MGPRRRDARILKHELNCNMVRCSHYPQSPHFLDACDELGIMVWEEPPGWGHMGDAAFQARVLRDVRDMVVRDRNRPSVVVWGTRLNETQNYPALYAQARQIAYACDGSRQTTGAVAFRTTAGWAEDVFSYDDYHLAGGEPDLLPPVPGVAYLISESVGALNPAYRWFDPPPVLANQAFAHALAHDQAQSGIRYAGVLAWAGFDYYSAARNRKNWNALRTPGVIDTFRVPKPGAAIYQSQAAPATRAVIVPVFFWDSRSARPARDRAACSPPTATGWRSSRAAGTSQPRRRTGSGSATWPARPPSPTSPWTAAPSPACGWTATPGRGWPPFSSAATVCDRFPPPSCSKMIEPVRVSVTMSRTIARTPGRDQSRGSTDQASGVSPARAQ